MINTIYPVCVRSVCVGTGLVCLAIVVSSRADDPAPSEHWAYHALAKPDVPRVANGARARTSIDRFILAKLEAKRLSMSPDADRVTLVRRTYLDLIGLTPGPQVVDAFCADPSPDAHERLVDRLLAAPGFG